MKTYLSAPNSVIWDITSRCNLRCRHCYIEAGRRIEEPSTEEALSIMDQLKEAKVFSLSFSGGEPLLRDDLYELLQYAVKSFRVNVASNGLLIDEDTAEKLKSSGISSVQLSMDGLEEAHDYLRGKKGAFNSLTETTEILRKVGLPFGVTSVIYKKNYHQVREMISYAENLGAFAIRFYRLIYTGRGEDISSLDITTPEYKDVLKEIYNYRGKIYAVADEAFGFLLHGRETPHQWVGCQAGRTVAGIKANQQVVPCPMFEDPVFYCGKVPDEPFTDIWEKSPVLTRFRNLDTIHGKCHHCPHLYQCGGGCRAAVYAKTGDLYASDYRCFVEEIQ